MAPTSILARDCSSVTIHAPTGNCPVPSTFIPATAGAPASDSTVQLDAVNPRANQAAVTTSASDAAAIASGSTMRSTLRRAVRAGIGGSAPLCASGASTRSRRAISGSGAPRPVHR